MTSIIAKLREILPEVSDEISDLRAYSYNAANIPGVTNAVVWPTKVEEIQRIIRLAGIRKFSIIVRGAGSNINGLNIPDKSIVMDLSRMQRLISLQPNEQTLTVEPGVVFNRLAQVLSARGYTFPLPPKNNVTTVGGSVATNTFSRWSQRFGRLENWITNLEVVDGSGKVYNTKSIMNFVGRYGKTGVITKITFRFLPRKVTSMVVEEFENSEDMFERIREISQDAEVFSLEYADKFLRSLIDGKSIHTLFIEKESEKESVNPLGEIYLRNEHVLKKNHLVIKNTFIISQDKLFDFLKYFRMKKIPCYGSIGIGLISINLKKNELEMIQKITKMIKEFGQAIEGKGIFKLEQVQDLKKKFDPHGVLGK